MNLSRVKRGAERSKLLLQSKIATHQRLSSNRFVRSARSVALSLMAVRTIMLPVPMAQAAPVLAMPEDGEPPSTLVTTLIDPGVVRFDLVKANLNIVKPEIASVTVGKSVVTQQQEEEMKRLDDLRSQEERRRKEEAKRRADEEQRVMAVVQAVRPIGDLQEMVKKAAVEAFGESEWKAMLQIVNHESGFNPNARNPYSGACGLFQALPCTKMGGMEISNQISWGISYIRSRYGTPSRAWGFWLANRWY